MQDLVTWHVCWQASSGRGRIMSAMDVTDGHQRLMQRPSGPTSSAAQHSHLPSAITPVIERMLQVCCFNLGAKGAEGGLIRTFGLVECHGVFVLWQFHVSCQSRLAVCGTWQCVQDASGCWT